MKLFATSILFALSTSVAFAAGSGDHEHGEHKHDTVQSAGDHGNDEGHDHATDHHEMMAIGKPGSAENVDRTIEVTMRETDDGDMIFEPSSFAFSQGETIQFNVTNKGELEHEFVLDTIEGNAKHKELMAQMDMEHDDPNSVRLDPGLSDQIIWTFANAGTFEFACLIPGHYESGMHGPIEVAESAAPLTFTKGVVKKIKADQGKVTIIHEALTNLDMPAMTMVFRADEALISQMSEGQEIEFAADRVKGKLTVTDLK